jgi:hypothetical protein
MIMNQMLNMNPNNQIFNMFGGYQNFMNNLQNLAAQVQQMQQDPRAQVQQMMNNGQLNQQKFEQCRQIANAITGMNL